MWVLTRAINEYDQGGDYFECVFDHKPNAEEIKNIVDCSTEYAEHILKNGGRKDKENSWYYLTKMDSGEQYIHKNS